MSSTGVKAVASVTRPIKPIDGTRDGHIKRVTLPRERSDTHRWQCHYQYRSKHLILALRYYWVFSLVGIGILYWSIKQILLATVPYTFKLNTRVWWTPDTWWILLLNAPGILKDFIPFSFVFGACMPADPYRHSKKPKRRTFRLLRVCLVTRGTNALTVKKSIAPWTQLQHLDGRVRFHIVLDADTKLSWSDELPPFVSVNQVPQSFRPRLALYKARALEFFRRNIHLEEDDWVLHLDEETQLDSYAINAVLDFIERGNEDIGMGTVLFNTGAYWRNPFLTTAEMYRTVADWGLFRLPLRLCQRPLCGFTHGAFILINGGIENAVTWDTSCVTEDFWFGLQAVRLGAKFGWIDAIAREQPPMTLSDLINQRRRWFSGVWSAGSAWVRMAYICHIWSIMGSVHSLYGIFLRSTPLILPFWVLQWTAFDMAQSLFSTVSSCMIQDLDAGGIGTGTMVLHALFSWIFLPVYGSCEGLIKAYAIFYPPKGFHVIEKM